MCICWRLPSSGFPDFSDFSGLAPAFNATGDAHATPFMPTNHPDRRRYPAVGDLQRLCGATRLHRRIGAGRDAGD